VLEADIEDYEAEISDLDKDINDLKKRIEEVKGEIETKDKARMETHKAYVEEEEDLSSAISAIKRAMKALKDSKKDLEGDVGADPSFLQPMAAQVLTVVSRSRNAHISAEQVQKMVALSQLAKRAVPMSGKSHDYEYRSNDIIDTLQELLRTFNDNLKECENEEFESLSAHQKARLDLNNEKKFKTKEKEEKEARVDHLSEKLHTAEQNKDEETDAKESDEEFLEELHTQCERKAENWDQRSKARAKEIAALNEVVNILDTGKENYSANRKLNLAAKSSKVSFLQLKSAGSNAEAAIHRVVDSLSAQGAKLHSTVLTGLASQVLMGDDHFAKVRDTIKDLIAKLEADAEAEAEQKSFCDTEMKAAISHRDEQSLKMEQEKTTLEAKRAEKKELEAENQKLQEEIVELNLGIRDAKELREKEKASNEKTISMSTAGKEAVEKAIEVLSSMYSASALVQDKTRYKPPKSGRDGQTVEDLAPGSSDLGDYEGNKAAGGGIMALCEVIVSDFERTVEQTEQDEDDAVKAFNDFEKDSNKSIKDKKKEKKNNDADIAGCTDAITEAKDLLNEATEAKHDANKELTKLKPMCVANPETYEQRVQKREEEIEALKEAMRDLDEMGK
jgi:predicted  nucleic acid-binding Zn-ribbon protein